MAPHEGGVPGERVTRPRLGLDSATPFLAVALWWPSEARVARAAWRVDRRLATELVPCLDAFLREHAVAPADLAGIGVGVGPGSYAGARVGVAWAQGVRRALGIPLVGGDTLAARALAAIAAGGRGDVAVAARRGEAWCQTWAVTADGQPIAGADRRRRPLAALPADAVASLEVAPDAAWHARRVDDADAAPPRVHYAAETG